MRDVTMEQYSQALLRLQIRRKKGAVPRANEMWGICSQKSEIRVPKGVDESISSTAAGDRTLQQMRAACIEADAVSPCVAAACRHS